MAAEADKCFNAPKLIEFAPVAVGGAGGVAVAEAAEEAVAIEDFDI